MTGCTASWTPVPTPPLFRRIWRTPGTNYNFPHQQLSCFYSQWFLHGRAGLRCYDVTAGSLRREGRRGHSQRSRSRNRASSMARTAHTPREAELLRAGHSPLWQWQILTVTVCVSPNPCRSSTSSGTLYSPVGRSCAGSSFAEVAERRGRRQQGPGEDQGSISCDTANMYSVHCSLRVGNVQIPKADRIMLYGRYYYNALSFSLKQNDIKKHSKTGMIRTWNVISEFLHLKKRIILFFFSERTS